MGNSWVIVNVAKAERIDPGDFGLRYQHSPRDFGERLWGSDSWATRALEWLVLTGRWQGRDVCFAPEHGEVEWVDQTRAGDAGVEEDQLHWSSAYREIAHETRAAMTDEPISLPGRVVLACTATRGTVEVFDGRGRSLRVDVYADSQEWPYGDYLETTFGMDPFSWWLVPRIDALVDRLSDWTPYAIRAVLAETHASIDAPASVVLQCTTAGWECRVFAASSALLGHQFGVADDPELAELTAQLANFPQLAHALARSLVPSPGDIVASLQGAVRLLDPPTTM